VGLVGIRLGGRRRQVDAKGAAGSLGIGARDHRTALRLDDVAHQAEAEAAPRDAARGGVAAAIEGFEEMRQLGAVETRPRSSTVTSTPPPAPASATTPTQLARAPYLTAFSIRFCSARCNAPASPCTSGNSPATLRSTATRFSSSNQRESASARSTSAPTAMRSLRRSRRRDCMPANSRT
jgi:hypothetical protein